MSEQTTQEELANMSQEEIAELQKKNCVFCKIIKGEIPSRKVYEDDKIIAVMDIYPAVKGHILVMPKEHMPIMPLIPPETFKFMFRKVKYLTKGVKNGLPSAKTNIFIANGAAAGQQSPHFLFHIVPRDEGDGLDNFNIPEKDIDQNELLPVLKANISKIFTQHLKKEGKVAVKPPSKEDLASFLESNPMMKEAIINTPDQFKASIEKNPQLKAMFNGVDIDKLSQKLSEFENARKEQERAIPKPTQAEIKEDISKTPSANAGPMSKEQKGAEETEILEPSNAANKTPPTEENDIPTPENVIEKPTDPLPHNEPTEEIKGGVTQERRERIIEREELEPKPKRVKEPAAEGSIELESKIANQEDEDSNLSEEKRKEKEKKKMLDNIGNLFK